MRSIATATVLVVAVLATVQSAAVEDKSQDSNAVQAQDKTVEVEDNLMAEQRHAIGSSPSLRRMIRKTNRALRGRSFFRSMGNEIMNYLGFGSDDYDDYDESDYFYPQFEGNSVVAGGPGSSYSFYNPYGNYHPARDDNFEEEEEEEADGYGWGDFAFDAAVVAVPMAMLFAAMPTGLFTIPVLGRSLSNNIEDTIKPYEMNILKAVEKADFLSYTTRECQERVFCEIAQTGRQRESSVIQKLAYFTAQLTPDHYADSYGVGKLFKAARDGHCQEYKCVPLMTAPQVSGQQ